MPSIERELLRKLVEQIEIGNLTDEHGHNFKMNIAFLNAKAFLYPQPPTNGGELPKQ